MSKLDRKPRPGAEDGGVSLRDGSPTYVRELKRTAMTAAVLFVALLVGGTLYLNRGKATSTPAAQQASAGQKPPVVETADEEFERLQREKLARLGVKSASMTVVEAAAAPAPAPTRTRPELETDTVADVSDEDRPKPVGNSPAPRAMVDAPASPPSTVTERSAPRVEAALPPEPAAAVARTATATEPATPPVPVPVPSRPLVVDVPVTAKPSERPAQAIASAPQAAAPAPVPPAPAVAAAPRESDPRPVTAPTVTAKTIASPAAAPVPSRPLVVDVPVTAKPSEGPAQVISSAPVAVATALAPPAPTVAPSPREIRPRPVVAPTASAAYAPPAPAPAVPPAVTVAVAAPVVPAAPDLATAPRVAEPRLATLPQPAPKAPAHQRAKPSPAPIAEPAVVQPSPVETAPKPVAAPASPPAAPVPPVTVKAAAPAKFAAPPTPPTPTATLAVGTGAAPTRPTPIARGPLATLDSAAPPLQVPPPAQASLPKEPSVPPSEAPEPESMWRSVVASISAMLRPARQLDTLDSPTLQDCPECPVLALVRPGYFTTSVDGRRSVRTRINRPFALGQSPVTVAQYARFVAWTGRAKPACDALDGDPGRPVTCVTVEDARDYVKWLGGQSGQVYRLPSAAEWEYASSRAGESNSDEPDPTIFAVRHMGGKVAEIVADCWIAEDVAGPTDGTALVVDGGCRPRVLISYGESEATYLGKSTMRRKIDFGETAPHIGFRIARELVLTRRF